MLIVLNGIPDAHAPDRLEDSYANFKDEVGVI